MANETSATSAIHRPAIPEADLRTLRQAVDQLPGIDADERARMQAYLTPREDSPDSDPTRPRIHRLGDLLGEFDEYAAAAHEAYVSKKPLGITTGLERLDEAIGKRLAPGLHALIANTGKGKTALALQIAATCGFPALFVTCEMAPVELLRRITARVTGTFLGDLQKGVIPPDRAGQAARQAITTCPNLALADATCGYISADTIAQAAEDLRGDSPHSLIVIDSLHSWAARAPGAVEEYATLNAALMGLVSLAARVKCPVLYIAEPNREASKSDKSLSVNSGAGTRRIEFLAETVIALEAPPGVKEDANCEIEMTVQLKKNRSGKTKQPIDVRFSGRLQRFREV